jgi:hypothetical protein
MDEGRSGPARPRINVICWNCGELARLKTIEAFPFTKGITEATYKCLKCGTDMKQALRAADQITNHRLVHT